MNKTIMTVICRKGKVTIFYNTGFYQSKVLKGTLWNYNSEYVTLFLESEKKLKVYDVNLYCVKTIDLISSNY